METTTRITRRQLTCLALAATAGSATRVSAQTPAQPTWPGDRPVRLIVAALPGSQPDFTARYLADQLSRQTGGSFAVLNRAGGLGIPALTEVANAAPDGTTLLVGNINTNGLAPALNEKKYTFDLKTGLKPITMLSDSASALVGSPKLPQGFEESLALWQANPGKYAYFAAGHGSFGHVWFARLVKDRNLDLLFVPVKGGLEGMQLLKEGSVHYAYVPLASFINQLRNKDVQALFVTTPQRLPEFPSVPTLREVGLGPDYVLNSWVGLFGPGRMPPPLVAAIHRTFTSAVNQPEMGALYARAYMVQSVSATPEEFERFVDRQIENVKVTAQRAGIRLD